MSTSQNKFAFFGTSDFSIGILDALFKEGFRPAAVVTFPDKPEGRKLVLSPNVVKSWAVAREIPVIESLSFRNNPRVEQELADLGAEIFVVASFGAILPDSIIYMPPHKTLNVHPSLLPKLRGPAPIQGAILGEQSTGVSIMRLDSKMDEGPIIAAKAVPFTQWPVGYKEAEAKLAEAGGKLLAEVLPKWISGELQETEQGPDATYTKKIEKADADISNDDAQIAYKKTLAYEAWPRARMGDLIITKAHIEGEKLVPDLVIPPGRKEMPYADYLRGNH